MDFLASMVLVGAGATAVTDLWSLARKRLFGMAPPDFGLVGRWIGHMPRGRFRHDSIAAAPAVHGEQLLGWGVHYLIGIAFAGILLGVWGLEWLRQPRLLPALIVGAGTIVAPLLSGALLSVIMVSIVSAFVLATSQGLKPGFAAQWLRSCATTWPVAFAAVTLLAPRVRRVVARVTNPA